MRIVQRRASASDEWPTPQPVFDRLNAQYGPFNLDPCATPENAKCTVFFTRVDDGLQQDWGTSTVFVNPPYSQIWEWARKSYQSAEQGACVVMLVPVRAGSQWWHDWVWGRSEVVYLRGRIKFGRSNAPFDSCLVVYRPYHVGVS